jgi:hypothetical protein
MNGTTRLWVRVNPFRNIDLWDNTFGGDFFLLFLVVSDFISIHPWQGSFPSKSIGLFASLLYTFDSFGFVLSR